VLSQDRGQAKNVVTCFISEHSVVINGIHFGLSTMKVRRLRWYRHILRECEGDCIREFCCPPHFLQMLRAFHDGMSARVTVGGHESDP